MKRIVSVSSSEDGYKMDLNPGSRSNEKSPKKQRIDTTKEARGSAIQRLFNQGRGSGTQMISKTPAKKRENSEKHLDEDSAPAPSRMISLNGSKKFKTIGRQSNSMEKESGSTSKTTPRMVSLSSIKKVKVSEDHFTRQAPRTVNTNSDIRSASSSGRKMVSLASIKKVKVTEDQFARERPRNISTSSDSSRRRGRSFERRSFTKKTNGTNDSVNRTRSLSASGLGTHEFRVATWLDRLAKLEAEKHSKEVTVQGMKWNALPRRRSRAEMRQARAMAEAAKVQAPSALRSLKLGQAESRKFLAQVSKKQPPTKKFNAVKVNTVSIPKAPTRRTSLPPGCIKIDGAMKEGGGQLIRNAVALSAITGKPLFINNIRGGRGRPGLRPQHCTGIQLITQISQGSSAEGLQVGSQEILFVPGTLTTSKRHKADPRTAGSIALLLQIALPCFLFCKGTGFSQVKLCGGTTVPFAAPIDHFTMVLYPLLRTMGVRCNFKIAKRGYYPEGGGEVIVASQAVEKLDPITLIEQGDLTKIQAGVFCNAGSHKLDLLAEKVEEELRAHFPEEVEVEITKLVDPSEEKPKTGKGATWGVQLAATTSTGGILGADEFGDANSPKNASQIARQATKKLLKTWESGACVDEHTADQLVLFMAFASATSMIRIPKQTLQSSKHLETSIHIAKLFLACNFSVEPCQEFGNTIIVKCNEG